MAKSSIIFSPFFFGLLFLVLISVISEGGGGVSGQNLYCDPGTGVPRGAQSMDSCSFYCPDYCLKNYGGMGVTTGKCFSIPNVNTRTQICFCCVVLKS
ncbi:hypothetical protein MKX01_005157 [Papaver californicum]|nr:hypothetical protein MKX01_005157 [Papaver californicum]